MRKIFGSRPRRPAEAPREEAPPAAQERPPMAARASFRLSSETPRVSRDYANRVLITGEPLPSRVIQDVSITVSELVTASYLAGASTVDLDIEVYPDQVAATVRDDRSPDAVIEPPTNSLREMLLDAMTTSRLARWDGGAFVNVVRFSTRLG